MLLNSESKSPLLLFQTQTCLLLVSQNFFLVQKKWDTKSKDWEEVGEVEDIIKVDIFLNFDICLKFDFFVKFYIFLNLYNFRIWYFDQQQLIFWSNTLSCKIDIFINNW